MGIEGLLAGLGRYYPELEQSLHTKVNNARQVRDLRRILRDTLYVEGTCMQEVNDRHLAMYKVIEKYCFDHEDPDQAIRNMRFFSEGYDGFGLSEEQLTALRNRILAEYDPNPREIADLGKMLFHTGKYEFGSIAFLLIKKHRPRMDRYVYERVKEWVESGVENWAHADLLASKITPVFLELGIASMEDFEQWKASSSKWARRVAILTMIWQINKMEAIALLDFVSPMMNEEERVVQQGIGRFLRELWAVHPEETEAFLERHRGVCGTTLMQEATERMHPFKRKLFIPQIQRPRKNYKKPRSK